MALLIVLGFIGGALSTVTGMGGGLLLVAVLGALHGPHSALAFTAPALLASNIHRSLMFRQHIEVRVAKAFALGAVPGAFLGGWLVPALPPWALSAVLVGATSATLARVLGLVSFRPRPATIRSGGFGIGVLAATAGGAGVLTGPLFLSAGLTGTVYVATVSVAAVSLHIGRVAGYGLGGLFDGAQVASIAVLAGALMAGNHAGKLLRRRLDARNELPLEIGALVVCTLLAVAGLLRS